MAAATTHDPEIPTEFTEDAWLEFAGSHSTPIKFHKNTGYFYYWESDSQGKEQIRCACKQFMVKHHESTCVNNETEYEMLDKCWVSDWFLLGSPDKWHNHPPPSRVSVELELFKWQVNLTFMKNRNAVTINHVIEEMYEGWPFVLLLSKSQLKILFKNEPEEESTFLDQDKIDSMMAILMSWSEYWGNPLEYNGNLKFEQCCDGIKEKTSKKRSLPSREPSTTSRSQKKLKLPEVKDDDYDTEPLPDNDGDPQPNRIIEFEPIASGSRDRTPSPRRYKPRNTKVAKINNEKAEDVIELPEIVVPVAPPVAPLALAVPKLEPGLQEENTTTTIKEEKKAEKKVTAIPLKNGKPWGPYSLRQPAGELVLVIDKEEVSEPIAKVSRFAENLVKQSQKIDNRDGIDIFAVPLSKSIGSRSTVERFVFGKALCAKQHMTVLVVGITGVGQTKLINGIINYIFNVEKEDKFRFEMVEEKKEDESNVISVYDIHHAEGFRISYSLTIVNTPSYSTDTTTDTDTTIDTKTLFSNRKLIQTFREFFEDVNGIHEIDLVCNVVLKDGNRNPFLSIFGYNVEENITSFWLRNNEQCPFDELIQRFFSHLITTKTKSLEDTKQVLQAMKRLEESANSFIHNMKSSTAKKEEMQNANRVFTICQSQIEANNNTETKFSLETLEHNYSKDISWKKIESQGKDLFHLLAMEFDGIAKTMLEQLEVARVSIRQLKRMSRGNPYLTEKLYDLLYDVEEMLKKQGYEENIENLKENSN